MPLLEISLSEMLLSQNYEECDRSLTTPLSPPLCINDNTVTEINPDSIPGGGKLKCKVTSDYYNRALSGWEPFIEPWR